MHLPIGMGRYRADAGIIAGTEGHRFEKRVSCVARGSSLRERRVYVWHPLLGAGQIITVKAERDERDCCGLTSDLTVSLTVTMNISMTVERLRPCLPDLVA
jgi:hypothetical protein